MPSSRPAVETLLLPGLNGSPAGHWQAVWAAERPDARMLLQDDWGCPTLEDWLGRLEEMLAFSDPVWLVAHSLGCLLAAQLADRPLARMIKGALLVAPCDLARVETLHPCVVRFGAMPTKRLPFPSLVVASRNDPYMHFDMAERMARCWGSDLADLGAAGHINIASGFGRWPIGFTLLDRLQDRAARSRRALCTPLSLTPPSSRHSSARP